MEVRRTEERDVAAVMRIIAETREYFRKEGIPQWQGEYPSEESIRKDMQNGNAYVLTDDGEVIGTAAIIRGPDPDYAYIENGAWLNDEEYIVIHRIAVLPERKGQGAAAEFFRFAAEEAGRKGIRNFRVDTHEKNASMRRFLIKNGFTPCGTVYMHDGAPRIGHQKITE